MKVKILKSSGWYQNNVGNEFEIYNYDIDDDLRFSVINCGWIFSHHCIITELPESFCVKKSDDGIKWRKYLDWLNKTYGSEFDGNHWECYGSYKGGGWYAYTSFGTEIHIDDMIKHIDYMKTKDSITVKYENGKFIEVKEEEVKETNMNTQKLSRQGLKEIHSVACLKWKNILKTYGLRNPLEDYIELSQEEVNTMFLACTKEQLPILSKYLKQEDDGSVDVKDCKITPNHLIGVRIFGKYENKSFYLFNEFNWEIKTDEYDQLCLIPTKKK